MLEQEIGRYAKNLKSGDLPPEREIRYLCELVCLSSNHDNSIQGLIDLKKERKKKFGTTIQVPGSSASLLQE